METSDNPLTPSAVRPGSDVLNRPDPRRWWELALLCGAFFMVLLDSTIVLVALPSIQADIGFSEQGLQWVLSAYALTFGGLLLLGGRVADLLGRRRLFTGARTRWLVGGSPTRESRPVEEAGRRHALVVPLHKEVRRGTLAGVLRDAGMSSEQLRELL